MIQAEHGDFFMKRRRKGSGVPEKQSFKKIFLKISDIFF